MSSVATLAARARALLDLGRNADAERLLVEAMPLDPDNAEIHLLLSHALRTSDTKQSLALARRAVALSPSSPDMFVNLAWAATTARNADEAVEAARESIRLDPSYVSGYHVAAQVMTHHKWLLPEAEHMANIARQLAPHDPTTWVAVGNVALARGDQHAGERAYREALRLEPENTTAKMNLAIIQERSGRLGDAVDLLQAIVRLDPRDSEARRRIDDLLVGFMSHLLWLALVVALMTALLIDELKG